METLREVTHFKLNYCPLQNMYNVTNEILTEYTKDEGVSYWFDADTKDNLMLASNSMFIQIAKQRAGNNIYSTKVFRGFYEEFKSLKFDSKIDLQKTLIIRLETFIKEKQKEK